MKLICLLLLGSLMMAGCFHKAPENRNAEPEIQEEISDPAKTARQNPSQDSQDKDSIQQSDENSSDAKSKENGKDSSEQNTVSLKEEKPAEQPETRNAQSTGDELDSIDSQSAGGKSREELERQKPDPALVKENAAKAAGHYYYDQLSEPEKHVFDQILTGVMGGMDTIALDWPADLGTVEKVNYILHWDFPELFFLGNKFTYYETDEGVVAYQPTYLMEEDEYKSMMDKVNQKVAELSASMSGMSPYEKELFVHDWLVDNVTYNKDTPYCGTLYGALVEGQAKCGGYSAAMSWVLENNGVRCIQLIGDATNMDRTEAHAWNCVQMPDGWYYADACWDDLDASISLQGVDKLQGIYNFFNFPYDEMIANRDITQTNTYLGSVPADNLDTYNYYKKNGLYASSLDEAAAILENQVAGEQTPFGTPFIIKFADTSVYEQFKGKMSDLMQQIVNEHSIPSINCHYISIDSETTLIIQADAS